MGELIMKEIILYYFTGSGNTLKIAQKVKDVFVKLDYTCELSRMEEVIDIDLEKYEYIGLLFPVAIQSTFPVVWDFINRLPYQQGKKIFMIDTMEQFSGGVVGPVKRVLQKKGYDCVAALEVKMNSSMQTKLNDLNKVAEKNKKALKDAEQFIYDMLKGKVKWNRVPLLSDGMRSISKGRSIWTSTSKKININHDLCVRCNICIKKCPVDAMAMINDKIVINHSLCNSCMRCIHNCPKDAFECGGKKVIRYK